jgi:hypothetical protein
MYECLYTGIGQMIAAYAPNAVFASLVNPLVITTPFKHRTQQHRDRLTTTKKTLPAFPGAVGSPQVKYHLIVCALLYYFCWYFTCGLPTAPGNAGSVFFVVVCEDRIRSVGGNHLADTGVKALVHYLEFLSVVSFHLSRFVVSWCHIARLNRFGNIGKHYLLMGIWEYH